MIPCAATTWGVNDVRTASAVAARGGRAAAYPREAVVPGLAGAGGDALAAVVDLALDVGAVVRVHGGDSSVVRLVTEGSLPEVAAHIGQLPYLCPRWCRGALGQAEGVTGTPTAEEFLADHALGL